MGLRPQGGASSSLSLPGWDCQALRAAKVEIDSDLASPGVLRQLLASSASHGFTALLAAM